jgi:hypothetical protein
VGGEGGDGQDGESETGAFHGAFLCVCVDDGVTVFPASQAKNQTRSNPPLRLLQ